MSRSISSPVVGDRANTSSTDIMKQPQPPAQNEPADRITESQSNVQRTHDLHGGHDTQDVRLSSSTAWGNLLKLIDKVGHERRVGSIDRLRNVGELKPLIEALDRLFEDANHILTMPSNSEDAQDTIRQLQRSSKQCRDLATKFKDSSLDFQQKEQSLVLLESRLQRKEIEFFERSQNPDEGGRPEDEDGESSSTGSHTHDGNTLVKDYHESLQEANYLREALVNYDTSYMRCMTIRDRKKNAGQTIKPSDSRFKQKYLQGRKSRLNDLVAAHKQMNQLWQQCVEQNLQVERPSIPSIAEDNLLNQMNQTPQTILNYAASTTGNRGSADLPGALLVGDSDPESRVSSWLDDVDAQSGEEAGSAEETQWDAPLAPHAQAAENRTPLLESPPVHFLESQNYENPHHL